MAALDALGGVLFLSHFRYNGAFWTMPIELACSYAVFLVLPFVLRTPTTTLVLLLAVASVSTLATYPWLTCFMAGILLVRLRHKGIFDDDGIVRRLVRTHRLVTPGLWALAVTLALWPEWIAEYVSIPAFLQPRDSLQIFSAVLLVVLRCSSRRFQAALDSPVVRLMGKVSFAVYLLHLPVLCSLSSRTYLLACLMARYVDRFAIDFGKKALERRLRRLVL